MTAEAGAERSTTVGEEAKRHGGESREEAAEAVGGGGSLISRQAQAVLALQRAAGNQGVAYLLRPPARPQRRAPDPTPPTGHGPAGPGPAGPSGAGPIDGDGAGPAGGVQQASDGGAVLVLQRQPPGTTTAPAPPPGAPNPAKPSLTDLAIKLLTPTKPARDGDALIYRGFRFTADKEQVRTELLDVFTKVVYGAKTREETLDVFVDDAIKDLVPEKIVDRRPAADKDKGPATDKLAADVRAALDAGRGNVHSEHSKFLIEFQKTAVDVTDETLTKSREQVEKERDRYGVKADHIEILGFVLRDKSTMARTPDTVALEKAILGMNTKYIAWAVAKGLKSGGMSIYGAGAPEAIQKTETEYNTARVVAEKEFPVLAAFELDLAKGLELEGTFKRLMEEPASMIGPQIKNKLENISDARNSIWEKTSRIWDLPGIISLTSSRMKVEPKSHHALAIEDKAREKREELVNRQLILGAIAMGLALLAAPITAGGSVVAGGIVTAAGLGVGALMTIEQAQAAMIQQAQSGTAFQKAQAISQQAPDWFWVAVDVLATLVDLGAAAAEFKMFIKLRKQVTAAKGVGAAARDEKALNEALAELKKRGNSRKAGLGDRMEADAKVRSPSADDIAMAAVEAKAAEDIGAQLAGIKKMPRSQAGTVLTQAVELLPEAEVLRKTGGWSELVAAVGSDAPALRRLDDYRALLAHEAEAALVAAGDLAPNVAKDTARTYVAKRSGFAETAVEALLGIEIQLLGEMLAKDDSGMKVSVFGYKLDLSQITKEDAEPATPVQRVPSTMTREEKALSGFTGDTFELIGSEGLRAGVFVNHGVPRFDFLAPGQYNPSGWGIDRIGFVMDGSNLRVYQIEMKYIDVGSAHVPHLGLTEHGTQTGLAWTTNAAEQLLGANNKVAAASRLEIEKALKGLGLTADAATMERILLRRLPKADVIILTTFYAPLHVLQAQARGLIRQGRSVIIVPARPLFGPRGGRLP